MTETFYQDHLDRVSRSFAFCISKLDPPLRQWISLSYLMCRILDTVEDSHWPEASVKEAQYSAFQRFLHHPTDGEEIAVWAARFPQTLPEGEKKLLGDASLIFRDLRESPPDIRQSIRDTVQRMTAGMSYYSSREEGTLKLVDLTDVNRYCYFVAGVVGELLTRLLFSFRRDFQPGPDFMKNAFHFGLFLQKVNLLKDQRGDEREGRFLVPDRKVLLSSLRENAEGAVDYLTALPLEEAGYRTFCAWSLFLGAASLEWIEKSYEADDGSKIPRSVTQELLTAVEAMAQDNGALRNRFEMHFPKFPSVSPDARPKNHADWFTRLSGASLGSHELVDLRMI